MIQELRPEFGLAILLEVSGMPRATFYYHMKRLQKPDKYAEVKEQITQIFHENRGRYGYRRITQELKNRGFCINHKTVARLMKALDLVCRVRMKKYRSYKGEVGKVAPNLLQRDFHAAAPNQKWVTDVTEFALFGQKLYLSPILDLHSSDLVAYTISDRPVLSMVTSMVEKAIAVLPPGAEPILHSDQGWQYQHKNYQRLLVDNHIRQSMSRKGNCLDNAVMENFFGLLKSELLYLQSFDSIDHFKDELIDYLHYTLIITGHNVIVARKEDVAFAKATHIPVSLCGSRVFTNNNFSITDMHGMDDLIVTSHALFFIHKNLLKRKSGMVIHAGQKYN